MRAESTFYFICLRHIANKDDRERHFVHYTIVRISCSSSISLIFVSKIYLAMKIEFESGRLKTTISVN